MLKKISGLLRKPRVVALFACRYDKQLVPDLLKNIESFVDDYIMYDDSDNKSLWYHEGETRRMLIEKARVRGFDWVICVDPDERFECNAGLKIRELIKNNSKKMIYSFKFRELWTFDSYRVDGIWGKKHKPILFPLLKGQEFMNIPVHSVWHPINHDYGIELLDINLYHLKMIIPEARKQRVALYNLIDKDKKIQAIGYDYLIDETDMILEKIPKGREYFPEYDSAYNIRQL